MKRFARVAAIAAALSFSGSALAAAPVGNNYTFNWTGNCVDCAAAAMQAAFPVNATLQVTGYTLGNAFNNSNFVQFDYSGSNLISPFSVTVSPYTLEAFSGSVGAAPGAYDVTVLGFPLSFSGMSNGNWEVFDINIADYGNQGTWSLVQNNSGVPEPATWAMMLLGFAAVGAAMRRKQAAKVSYNFA